MRLGKTFGLGISSILAFSLLLSACSKAGTTASSSSPAANASSPAATVAATAAPAETPAPAATAASSKKITIMVGGLEKVIYLPFKLTEILGYYKDEGLNVELVNEGAGQNAEEAMIAGEVQGVGGFYDHSIDLQSKGKNVESVVQMAKVSGERLMVADRVKDKIKSVADLKGSTIGVTGLGSSTNFLANYLVVKGGHETKDYTPIPVGAGATLIAAMQAGKIDLAVTTEPTVSLLLAKHLASVLVDMNSSEGSKQSLGGEYPATSLYMMSDYVQKNPEIVQHLANAYVKTLKYISTHTPEEITDKLPKEYLAGDRDLYLTALKGSIGMFTPDGIMPTGGPELVLTVLSAYNKKLKDANIKLDQTYTREFALKAAQAK
jgi:NitT/TauT family transport system substrate-binding protein